MIKPKQDLSTALKMLDTIVEEMNSGTVDVQTGLKKFEEAVELIIFCRGELKEAENKLSGRFMVMMGDDIYSKRDVSACLEHPWAILVKKMELRKIIWIIIGFILLPLVLAVGVLFFGVIAAIILIIVVLFALLSFIFYLNRRFKYALYKFRTNAPGYTQRTEQTIKKTKTKGKGEEVVIEQIEEVIEKKE